MIETRVLTADEWAVFRDVKLRALRDSPDVFEDRLHALVDLDEAGWRHEVRNRRELDGRQLVATLDGAVVGMTYVAPDRFHAGYGYIGSMWVEPAVRRQGVARALLAAALDVIRGWRFGWARLGVTEGDDAAFALYRSAGFAETGLRKRMSTDSAITVIELVLPLT